MASFVLSFFPLDVLDEIWDLIESVSGGFLTYFYVNTTFRAMFLNDFAAVYVQVHVSTFIIYRRK